MDFSSCICPPFLARWVNLFTDILQLNCKAQKWPTDMSDPVTQLPKNGLEVCVVQARITKTYWPTIKMYWTFIACNTRNTWQAQPLGSMGWVCLLAHFSFLGGWWGNFISLFYRLHAVSLSIVSVAYPFPQWILSLRGTLLNLVRCTLAIWYALRRPCSWGFRQGLWQIKSQWFEMCRLVRCWRRKWISH